MFVDVNVYKDFCYRDFCTHIDENVPPFQDSQFRMVPGLPSSNQVLLEG